MPHEQRHHHSRRKRIARIYLCGVTLLIIAGDALLMRFVFSEANPFRLLIGLLIGQIAAAVLLVGAVWRRRAWARYVLMLLLALIIAIMGMVTLILGARPDLATSHAYVLLTGGIFALLAADTWLLFSKRLHYLAAHAG